MAQTLQKNAQQKKEKDQVGEFFKPITDFLAKLSKKEKLAYSLIIAGIVLVIIGIILW
jgi:hypothetical protein